MREPTEDQRFWMVARLPGREDTRTRPTVVYRKRSAALAAAERLSRETSARHVILAVEEVVHPTDGHQRSLGL